MQKREEKASNTSDQTTDLREKSPFSAAEALLASIAVVLLLVIVVYSFFHSDRRADPVIVYLAESGGSAVSAADPAQSEALTEVPGINLAATTSEAAETVEESAVSTEEIATVNINTASVPELMALPGIGEVKASAIVAYREEFGDFLSVSQLLNVDGIGEKTLEKIREYIVLS